MAKYINDIINSELIARTNNVKIRQEYGTVGSDANVIAAGANGKALFTTSYGIDKIVYVTVNGVTQILGRDYTQVSEFKIEFNGALLSGRTVNIGYMYNFNTMTSLGIPPTLTTFTVSPVNGNSGILTFALNISKNSAKNIFWSIHKNGESEPVLNTDGLPLTGTTLSAVAVAGDLKLDFEVTSQMALLLAGDDIPFTIIVIYDMTDDGSSLNEKLVGTATYRVDAIAAAVLNLSIRPTTTIREAGTYEHIVTYNVMTRGYSDLIWELTDSSGQISASGDMTDIPTNESEKVAHEIKIGDPSVTYILTTKEAGGSVVQSKTARIDVSIPRPVVNGKAGYISFEMYAGSASAPFNFITSAQMFYERVADEYITVDVPLTTSGVEIAIDSADLAWADPGLPVYGCTIIPKQSAPNGVKITDSVGSNISNTFLEFDDTENNSWIFIKDHALAPEFSSAVAPFIIVKK